VASVRTGERGGTTGGAGGEGAATPPRRAGEASVAGVAADSLACAAVPSRRPTWWVVGLLVGLLTVPAAATSAAAQAQDPLVAEALAALERTQADAHAAANKVAATNERRDSVAAQLAANGARIAELQAQLPVLKAQEDELRRVLRQRAVALYTSHGPLGHYDAYVPDPSLDQARRRVLAEDAARLDHVHADQLAAIQVQLAQAETQLQHEQTALEAERAQLDQLAVQAAAEQAVMNQRVADANAALERAKQLGALRAAGREPVQGPSVLTEAQMAGWIRAQGYHPRTETAIDNVAQMYIQEGNDEDVRGDFAFAQAVVETRGFEAAPANNFSGMGWCDSCVRGTRFPAPRDGIRAQIQHLLNYADPSSRAAKLHHAPSPFWYGPDPAAAAQKFDSFFAKGWAPTWKDMGHGNWATDPAYSGKVIRVFNAMVAFAQSGG
jgi:peptidoglycan hydrolase CwlO-like protein